MSSTSKSAAIVTPVKPDVHTGGTMFRIPRAPLGRKDAGKKAD